jgi:DNA-binding Lrp family transcriptional regulator
MKHILERVVLLALSQELDSLALQPPASVRPGEYLSKAIDRIRTRLSVLGITQEKIAQVVNEADARRVFVPSLVPNPAYWREQLHRHTRFYLVHSRASHYHALLDYLRGMPDISYATCYGDTDFVIHFNATDEHFRRFEATLDRLGVTSTILSVATVPYYLGHEERTNVRRANATSDEVDRALIARADNIDYAEIQRLVDSGVILGIVVREDHLATGRMRAYVNISLREDLSADARTALERKLIGLNATAVEGQAMPIVSLYRIHGRDYLLELICDDQAQLDVVTLGVQALDRAIDNTTTMVVARYTAVPELHAPPRMDTEERAQQLKEVVDKVLAPISDQLLAHVSEKHASRFSTLEPHMQWRILNLYQELTADSPYLRPGDGSNPLQPAVIELITGAIESDTSRIRNAGMTAIRDHVEHTHMTAVAQITDEIFGGEDQKWQSELKMRDAAWKKWGLRVWGEHVYPAWNAHPLLQHVFRVESDVLVSLRIVGDARNSFAHYNVTDITEVGYMMRVAREVFNHSYKILRWLDTLRETLANPVVPFQAVAKTIAAGRHGRELELLNSIRSLRVDLARLVIETSKDSDRQLHVIVQEIQSIADGVRELDITLVERISDRVLPLLTLQQRSSAAAALDALKGSVGTIPAGVASSLLAAVVATALKFGQ